MAEFGDKPDMEKGRKGEGGVKDEVPISGLNIQTEDGAVFRDVELVRKTSLEGERRPKLWF